MIQTFIDDNNNLVTTYDIDGMLYENAIWLAHQIKPPTSEFIKIAEQVITINKTQIIKYVGKCNKYKMYEIEKALLIQNGVNLDLHLKASVI